MKELDEKSIFFEKIKQLDEVKGVKKRNTINIIIYILLIIIMPIIILLGLFFKLEFLYVVAGILLIASFAYTFINKYKSIRIVIQLVKDKTLEFLENKYNKIDLSEGEKEGLCEKYTELIPKIRAIEELNKVSLDTDVELEYLIRLNVHNNDIDILTYEEEDYSVSSKSNINYLNFVIIANYPYNKILRIVRKNDDFSMNKNVFEKLFINNDQDVKKFLEKIDKKEDNYEYVQITEKQKELLVQINNETGIDFSIIIIDGLMYIKIKKMICTQIDSLKRIYDLQKCIEELFDGFIENI